MSMFDEITIAWNARNDALAGTAPSSHERTKALAVAMHKWTAAVNHLPGRNKLEWVERDGNLDCIVLGCYYLSHPFPPVDQVPQLLSMRQRRVA